MFTVSTNNFLVPRSLTWDKLVALYLYIYATTDVRGGSLSSVLAAANADVVFEDESHAEKVCINVDALRNYKELECGSAAEYVMNRYGLEEVFPGIKHLVKILNLNNTNGCLKSDKGSLVTLIRQCFSVVTVSDPKEWREVRLQAIALLWPAVHVYFEAAAIDEAKVVAMSNPFTRDNFAALLELLGAPKRVSLLQQIDEAFEAEETKKAKAARDAREMVATVFQVPLYKHVDSAIGHFIESDDTRVAGAYLKEHEKVVVLIVRRSKGNVAIFCRGKQDFDVLSQALNEREPDRWYHETRYNSPMLLNGSGSRHQPPTRLSQQEIIALVQANHKHKSRKWQPK